MSGDPRVFLGYRAGGTEDFFRIKGWDVWRSHLGVAVLNLQDLVNGNDNIATHVKGRVAIDLDIDRQSVTVNGCGDIDDHIRECVAKLGSPAGGLWLCYQPWPPTPPRNLDAVFAAMEKYRNYWK